VRQFVVLLILVVCAACAPGAAENTPAPTLILIPATATDTPTPIPPTSTASTLIDPQDVIPPTLTTVSIAALEGLTGAALVSQDPVAAELVGIAQRRVADDLDLPIRRIRLVDVRAVVWTDSALNCPLPEAEIVQQETDGYRIVLAAGDQEFLFHTDVDRVVPCAEENEDLPAGVLPTEEPIVEPAAEVTPEATQE
jgi:hypothetical protein